MVAMHQGWGFEKVKVQNQLSALSYQLSVLVQQIYVLCSLFFLAVVIVDKEGFCAEVILFLVKGTASLMVYT
jgi:hypothetical protein